MDSLFEGFEERSRKFLQLPLEQRINQCIKEHIEGNDFRCPSCGRYKLIEDPRGWKCHWLNCLNYIRDQKYYSVCDKITQEKK